jgi:hypothetical protein
MIKTITIMDHQHNGDSGFATLSFIGLFIQILGLGTIGSIIAIVSGVVSLVINYPKLKTRIQQIFKRK